MWLAKVQDRKDFLDRIDFELDERIAELLPTHKCSECKHYMEHMGYSARCKAVGLPESLIDPTFFNNYKRCIDVRTPGLYNHINKTLEHCNLFCKKGAGEALHPRAVRLMFSGFGLFILGVALGFLVF